MASHHNEHRALRRGIAVIAATLILTACGGGGTIAPTTSVATATTASGQAAIPTTVPTVTAPVAATPAASISAAPASVASTAATATKPVTAPTLSAGSAAGTVDPCALVTKADYLVVMGDAAGDPVKKDTPAVATPGFAKSSCDYKIAAGGKVQFVTVNIIQRGGTASSTQPGAPTNMQEYWEFTKKGWASTQATVTPLPEIGPEVYAVTNPLLAQVGAGTSVHFFKGGVVFDVQAVTGSGTVDEQNAAATVGAKKLAVLAFGRL